MFIANGTEQYGMLKLIAVDHMLKAACVLWLHGHMSHRAIFFPGAGRIICSQVFSSCFPNPSEITHRCVYQ